MKYVYLLMSLVIGFALAACTGTVEVDPTATAPQPETMETKPAPTEAPDEYPGAPGMAPAATTAPDSYPDVAGSEALPSGYPADNEDNLIWVLRPLGQQCEAAEEYEYADLTEAVEALESAGVEVLASETATVSVDEDCNLPTSEHFRVQIRAQHLEQAQSLMWEAE